MSRTMVWGVIVCMLVLTGTCCAPALRSIDRFTSYTPDPLVVVVRVGGAVDADWFRNVKQAMEVDNVFAVILWIESPGGSVSETKLLEHNLIVVRAQHPRVQLWVYSEHVLASGAYWSAMCADSIWVSPVAIVGSIGVYTVRVDSTRADSIAGVNWVYIYTGRNKIKGAVHSKLTDNEVSENMRGISRSHEEFLTEIFLSRFDQLNCAVQRRTFFSSEPDTAIVAQYLFEISDGRAWTGNDANFMGLVDGVYYFDELLRLLRLRGFSIETVDGTKLHDFWPGD